MFVPTTPVSARQTPSTPPGAPLRGGEREEEDVYEEEEVVHPEDDAGPSDDEADEVVEDHEDAIILSPPGLVRRCLLNMFDDESD